MTRLPPTVAAEEPTVTTTDRCPCGHLGDRSRECSCTPPMVARCRSRVSGPLLDRIDMHVEVPAVAYAEIAPEPRRRTA